MALRTIKNLDVSGKRVLVRCDFNVPLDERGNILDDFRIKKTIPTINYLIEKEAKVILMSHLDDPEGKVVERLKLDKIQERLMEYLDFSVVKAKDCIGKEIENWTKEMASGEILLLENLRFHKEEEENNKDFARSLSGLGDIYIDDAFGVCHRAHTSVVGVPAYLPSAAGLLLEKEVEVLDKILKSPQKPLITIIGGAKVETKVKFIDRILGVSDFILIGGLLNKEIKEKNITFKNYQKIIGASEGFDITTKDIILFKEKISKAKTIFWNGPFGKIEDKNFIQGTKEIAEAIIKSGAFSVVGGGETVEFINNIGLIDKFSHVSTGGGAMMVYLSGEKLPGIEVLI